MGLRYDLEDLVVDIGRKVGNLPSLYLGLPLGASYKLTVAWDGLGERS